MEELMPTRVLVADDHNLFAQALVHLLAQRYEVVDVVGDGKALLASTEKHKPDVVITDITMPLMSGLESARSLRKASYTPKIVFLTMHADAELARECFNCGGSAFVNKESSYDELLVAIDAVMANQQYLSPSIAGGFVDFATDAAAPNESEQLTSRQRRTDSSCDADEARRLDCDQTLQTTPELPGKIIVRGRTFTGFPAVLLPY